jgi:NitT/TauT family transport system substrate-binding protein
MNTARRNSGDRSSRRRFLVNTSTLTAAAYLCLPRTAAAEPPPEINRIRLVQLPAICAAPQYVAEELLRLEGFTEIEYVELADNKTPGAYNIAVGSCDITMWDVPGLMPLLDAGEPVVVLAGVHAGCFELFGNDRVNGIRDLKGKTVAVSVLGGSEYVLLSSMIAYVGLNPKKDVNWIAGQTVRDAMRLFVEGKADAFLGFAPQPQELRAKKIGRVIVNTAEDRPWSQYFCCAIAGNRDFVRKHPIATKRAIRAILKGADVCAQEPERAARTLTARGWEPRYDIALEVLKSLPYRRWREANPEDTLRFHALRLYETGIIRSTPQKIIAQGTDWRFLDELKKELKA